MIIHPMVMSPFRPVSCQRKSNLPNERQGATPISFTSSLLFFHFRQSMWSSEQLFTQRRPSCSTIVHSVNRLPPSNSVCHHHFLRRFQVFCANICGNFFLKASFDYLATCKFIVYTLLKWFVMVLADHGHPSSKWPKNLKTL